MERGRTLRAQAADELRELISREYAPGDRLPPEVELARRVGLSRNTIREAVGVLVNEGRVERKWGVGTTVIEPAPPTTMFLTGAAVLPVRDILSQSGRDVGLRLFAVSVERAPADIARELGVGADDELTRIRRVFTVDDRPAVFVEDWCLREIDGHRLDPSSLGDVDVDLINLFHEQIGRDLRELRGRLDAVPAAEELRDGGEAAPVVQVSQTVFDAHDEPVIYTRVQFVTTVVTLSVNRAFEAPSPVGRVAETG